MNKSYILLRMYDALRSGAGVKITDCCGRYEISVASFRRYIAFLRVYVAELCGRENVYDPGSVVYILK